jgi:hypothetical protein
MGYSDIQWERKESPYVALMRDLDKHVFSEAEVSFAQPIKKSINGQEMIVWDVKFEIMNGEDAPVIQVGGQLVHVPEKAMTTYGNPDQEVEPDAEPSNEPDTENPDDDESGKALEARKPKEKKGSEAEPEPDEPEATVEKPEGHFVYAWKVTAVIEPFYMSKVLDISKEIHSEMIKTIKNRMQGKIRDTGYRSDTQITKSFIEKDRKGRTLAISTGLFTSPVTPDSVPARIAAEDKNIRGILPPSVR